MSALMERIRAEHGLPSICAGAVVDGKIVSLDAVGVRRLGSPERVTTDDPYHCGSITKSFTAALFARRVQEGKVSWDTPISTLLPDDVGKMDPAFRALTARHFMAQRSGLSGESWPKDVPDRLIDWNGRSPSPRGEYVRLLLSAPPDYPAESRFEYSNANYVVLGAILERQVGRLWEEQTATSLLRPLGLKSAGFGAVGADGKTACPWGHAVQDGKLTPIPPGPGADNPATLGPSATLHMSVPDLLRWCAFQADEGRHGGPLRPKAFDALHTPAFGGEYAGGLVVLRRDWGGGTVFYHNGSNTMNYEVIWIAPRKRFGLVVASNAYTPDVDAALNEVAGALIKRCCP